MQSFSIPITSDMDLSKITFKITISPTDQIIVNNNEIIHHINNDYYEKYNVKNEWIEETNYEGGYIYFCECNHSIVSFKKQYSDNEISNHKKQKLNNHLHSVHHKRYIDRNKKKPILEFEI